MANIQARNGAFLIRVYDGIDDKTGKKKFRSMTYRPTETSPSKIKKEVQRVADEFEDQVKNGLFLDGEHLKFKEAVDLWLRDYGEPNLDSYSLESYMRVIRNYAIPAFGNMAIGKIRAANIQGIVSEMRKRGLAPGSIKRNLVAVNSVFRYAYKAEIIERNPCDRVQLPKDKPDTELHYFTEDQVTRFFDFIENYPVHAQYDEQAKIAEQRTNLMWNAYFHLAILTGFRRGEMIALKWSDVDFDNYTVSVNKAFAQSAYKGMYLKDPKTKSGIRTISVDEETMDILREWRTEARALSQDLGSLWEGSHVNTIGERFNDNFVFIDVKTGNAMFADTPSHKFKKIIERYNSMCDKGKELPHIRLHDLRHTSATLLIGENADIATVSKRLGHSKISTTLNVYTHQLPVKDREAADIFSKMFSKKEAVSKDGTNN